MKKIFIIIVLLISSFTYAQSTHGVETWRSNKTYSTNKLVSKDGVIYKANTTTTQTPPNTNWDVYGGGSSVNLNDQFIINSNYTTVVTNNHQKGLITGNVTITITDTGIVDDDNYELTLLNKYSADVPVVLGSGQSIEATQTMPSVIPKGMYLYLERTADNTWSVITGSNGGIAPTITNKTANYTTDVSENGYTLYFSAGSTITLDSSGLPIGFAQTVYNSSGSNMALSSSQAIEGGTTIPDATWAVYQLQATGNWIVSVQTSGGSGAVDSVNGQTGVVVLDADDIDDTSTTNKFATSAQLAAISTNSAKVSNATHTGDVTGSTALTINLGAVDIPHLSATGTPSSSTYLRGDNSWATISGGGIGGSIGENQIAFGDSSGDIEGSDDLTWDGNTLEIEGSSGNYALEISSSDFRLASFKRLTTGNAALSFGNTIEEWLLGTVNVNGNFAIGQENNLSNGYFYINRTTFNVGIGYQNQNPSETLGVIGSGSFTSTLQVDGDPTTGDQVGNRDYNDGRYAPIGSGGIGGTIGNNQIAVGDVNGNITGSNDLVFGSGFLTVNGTGIFTGNINVTGNVTTAAPTTNSHAVTKLYGDTNYATASHNHTVSQITDLDLSDYVTIDTEQEITGDKYWKNYNYYKDAQNDTIGLIHPNGQDIFNIASLNNHSLRLYGDAGITLASGSTIDIEDDTNIQGKLRAHYTHREENSNTSITIGANDLGKIIYATSNSAITVTIPESLTLDDGATFAVVQAGNGAVTIQAGGNGTIVSNSGSTTIGSKWGAVQVIQRGDNTDDWHLMGNLSAPVDAYGRAYKEIDIGTWNMDSTDSKSVAHGLSSTEWKTISDISIMIENDGTTEMHPWEDGLKGITIALGMVFTHGTSLTSTNVVMDRQTGGEFDSTDYNDGSQSRGTITFYYIPD